MHTRELRNTYFSELWNSAMDTIAEKLAMNLSEICFISENLGLVKVVSNNITSSDMRVRRLMTRRISDNKDGTYTMELLPGKTVKLIIENVSSKKVTIFKHALALISVINPYSTFILQPDMLMI